MTNSTPFTPVIAQSSWHGDYVDEQQTREKLLNTLPAELRARLDATNTWGFVKVSSIDTWQGRGNHAYRVYVGEYKHRTFMAASNAKPLDLARFTALLTEQLDDYERREKSRKAAQVVRDSQQAKIDELNDRLEAAGMKYTHRLSVMYGTVHLTIPIEDAEKIVDFIIEAQS